MERLQPAWSVVSSSPWMLALFAIAFLYIATKLYLRVRHLPVEIRGRDAQRRFAGGVRAAVISRAGNRCEFHVPFTPWRCRETTGLEADHVHPHSRGGSTSLGNGQALCKRHNRRKAARIPFAWELRRLAKRRSGYAPPGMPTTVMRREKPRG